jgi:hypothetical protein
MQRVVVHYLFFPSQIAAEDAAEEVRAIGSTARVEPAMPPRRSWVVLAESSSTDEKAFIRISKAFDGWYDGWESRPT